MASPRVLKSKTLYLLFRTRDVTGEPFGSHNTDVSVYISGPLHDQSHNDPWCGKAAWANPVPHTGEHHHPNRTLSFHKVNLRHETQGFFLWEIMPADKAVRKHLRNMFVRKKHYDWNASKVCMQVLRDLKIDRHHRDNLLSEAIMPEHSRGVLRTINAAETGRPHHGNLIVLPTNLTILKATPGEEIFKVIYDNARTIPVMEPVGFLTQHPHVHHQSHHHRPNDYPSSRHPYHSHHRSLRQVLSSSNSRTSSRSRGGQYYYNPKRSRRSSYPVTATQHPIPAEVVTYPANTQADPRIYGSTAAPMNYPQTAVRRGSVPQPQVIPVPVYEAAPPPAAAVEPTRVYVPQEAPGYPSSEAPAAAPQYAPLPDDASHLSSSSRSSSRSSKRHPIPRRSSQYYYQPRRPRSRPSRSSYSSSRRSTSDSVYEDDSIHGHLGVRKTLHRLTDKLMARDGPPSFSGHSSGASSEYGSVDGERRAEDGRLDALPAE